ncbi:MAG: cadmium resistance transporter [Cyanobacteriota bacterium]
METFVPAVLQASTAFVATNIDDLFILMLLFSRIRPTFRAWQVVCGQFVGIGALVAISLLSLLGRLAVPESWIGLLGLVPISLGLSQLAETFDAGTVDPAPPDDGSTMAEGVIAGVIGVAALTIANGSDNISVYMALLANGDSLSVPVFLGTFALLTGAWCLLAWWLTRISALAPVLRRFRRDLAPVLLVVIGTLVLHESHILSHPALAMVALACLAVMVVSLIQQLRRLLLARRLAVVSPP